MNENFLRDLVITVQAMDAPLIEPSERAKELFEAALARHQPFKILSEKQLKLVILQLLSKGRAEGGDIIAALNELKVRPKLSGEGVIYALLTRMEEETLVSGKFDQTMTRKSYKVVERGTDLLQSSGESVRNVSESLATLWAT